MAQKTVDICIAGGGPVGLTLAIALADMLGPELRLACIERRPLLEPSAPATDARAYAIAAGSRHVLETLGIWQGIADRAQPVTRIEITDSGLEHAIRPVRLAWSNLLDGDEPASHIVEADVLNGAIRQALASRPSISVLAPATIEAVVLGNDGARLTLSGSGIAEIDARLVVATDGRRSIVREAAGIRSLSWNSDQTGIVATVAHEKPHGGVAVQHFLPAGPFAILPLVGNRSCVTWSETRETAAQILAMDEEGFLGELEKRFGWKLGALRLDGPRAGHPLDFHIARSLVGTRLVLAGDAARTVHPIGGQGLNLGLRDVAALVEVIAEAMRLGLDPGDATVLARYEAWRRFDSVAAAGAYSALNLLFSKDSTVLRAIRGVGLGVVDQLDGLKRTLVNEAAGLTGDVPRLLRGERV